MRINRDRARQLLNEFDLETLFTQELGWDRHSQTLPIQVNEAEYTLTACAEKRGMVAFYYAAPSADAIPDHATRRKIERQVARTVHEHLIIYADRSNTTQIWQWVKREPGNPEQCRELTYNPTRQTGEALIQNLFGIAFSLEEEEGLTLVDVTSRVRATFDVEKVTKRFYDRFKKEHDAFLEFLDGIPDEGMQRWYVSVILNRLMFIYFIQAKGFLDGDLDYLSTKLTQSRLTGVDQYYKTFLCPLFFEGFAKPKNERSREMSRLLGNVPYLNGGIFQKHQIEEHHGESIQIPDAAFERLFKFFERYQWHLDDRPLRNDNEINPDVLGYIFEKYINQKQMGAYYTKEDITEYISKNTIIPFLLDTARKNCKIAFEPPTDSNTAAVWQLLRNDPDRYIYDAVKYGTEHELPPDIDAGIGDVSARIGWNAPAPSNYALPTEIWREVVARRERYKEVHAKLSRGEIHEVNDLITYNLNIRQFAQDIIENCEGPDLLRAIWKAVKAVTILDPTCGSGAFLFAALNILEPLYEACLDRMGSFVDELRYAANTPHPSKYSDFRADLDRINKHPNPTYFVLKSIIVNNLYGVDIMEEAIEICKLRLFLKMVAQIEDVNEIEPLPDIDFNIQAGNTLVGFTNFDEVKAAFQSQIDVNFVMNRIKEKTQDVQQLFERFREQQTDLGGVVTPADKKNLHQKLKSLETELNRYIAGQYGIDPSVESNYANWLDSHRPFHWFIQFYGILDKGGFDVIIGNPPYLEFRQVDYIPAVDWPSYQTRAIHAMCIDCSLRLLNQAGCISMIVPMALISTQRMKIIQNLLKKNRDVWYSNYSWRPGKLFDTVNRALTILVATAVKQHKIFSTNYQKWTSDNRDLLMSRVEYVEIPRHRVAAWAPKLGAEIESTLLNKCLEIRTVLRLFMRESRHRVYYRTTGGLYWKVFTDFPPAFTVNGRAAHSTRETSFGVDAPEIVKPVIAILSSNLFWWWYTISTTCRDLNPYDIQNFPISEGVLYTSELVTLGDMYLEDIQRHSTIMVRRQQQTGRTETQSFKIQKSKPIIDQIDRVLSQHYGFTDEELDFIINYDIKYRMGLGSD